MNTLLNAELAAPFLAVVRTGSFSAAADRLDSSQPTISRQILALEEAVGTTLFVRHARGVRLTPAGEQLVAPAEAIEQAVALFERTAIGARDVLSGSVRVAASEIVGTEVLIPALTEFRERYPAIAVELVLDNAATNLSMGDADLAVRLFRPSVPELIVKHVGSVQTAFFAAQNYLDRRGHPATLDALLEHDLIGFDSRGPLAESYAAADPRFTSDRFAIRTDSLTGHLMAARVGAGIAALQIPIARRYPELVQLFEPSTTPALPFYLTAHEDSRSGSSINAVWNWLDAVLRDYVNS
jgi:DNA-binding transcriptional LysR family regulator